MNVPPASQPVSKAEEHAEAAASPTFIHRLLPSIGKWLPFNPWARVVPALMGFIRRTVLLLEIPAPERPRLLWRIEVMERDIILPLKAAATALLLYSFYFRPWMGRVISALDIAVESTQIFLWFYIGFNLLVASMLFLLRRIPISVIEWTVFVTCLVDGIFLSVLTLVTGGYDSILYWMFLALIVRCAVSVPRAASQLMLNGTIIVCYVLSGLITIGVASYLPPEALAESGLSGADHPTEPLFLRLFLLCVLTVCAFAVQVLFEKQRRAEDEAREFAVREGQLRSAGRLAAEIAHQIKNPLSIITNALFSMERSLKHGRDVSEQIGIIQEEVARSDRIITQIMGYSQLAEGRVEKLHVQEELDTAIERVFPPAAGYAVAVHREFGPNLPPLLMQRRHFSEIIMNILQNARDALAGRPGDVWIRAVSLPDESIEVSIRDNGPGIPPGRLEQVFEPYFSTKAKGTGLGLATAKHNIELYGGTVRLESELGKGARFTLFFPARTLMKG